MWKRQPNWKKVILLTAVFLILLIVALFLFRNPIARSYLPAYLAGKTNSRVTLTISNIDIGLNGDLTLINPRLKFKNTFIDQAKTMELKELYFDTIHLYGVAIRDLLTGEGFIADSLYVTRPELTIKEQQGEVKSNFDLEHLITMLESNPSQAIEQKFKIGRIIIDYGKLRVDPLMDEGQITHVVDYALYVDNFSTLAEDNDAAGRILFSDDIQIRVENIDKFPISGYDLDLGSLFFSVLKNRLQISGVKLSPSVLSDSTNQIGLSAKLIEFTGLSMNELSGKEEIELQSARISNGYLITNTNRIDKSHQDVHNEFLKQLASDLIRFKLDTLGIQNFNLEFLEFLTDTISHLENLNLELYGVVIDSSMMDDVFRELVFDEFSFASGKGGFKLPSYGLWTSVDSICYNSKNERAEFFQLNIRDPRANPFAPGLELKAGKVTIDGISEKPIPKPLKMHLKVNITDVNGMIDLGHQIFQQESKNQGSNNILELIHLDGIQLMNANLTAFKNDNFSFHVQGLESELNNPLKYINGKVSPDLSNLRAEASNLEFHAESGIDFSTGPLTINNEDLHLSQVSFNSSLLSGKQLIRLDNLILDNFNFHEIANENILSGEAITFDNLSLGGEIFVPAPSASKKEATATILPFESIAIERININKISIDSKLINEGEIYTIKSDAGITLLDIHLNEPEIKLSDLANINGYINIKETSIKAPGQSLYLKELLVDLSADLLKLEELHIWQDSLIHQEKDLLFKSLHLPLFETSGIGTGELLNGKISFGDLKLRGLNLDMRYKQEKKFVITQDTSARHPLEIARIDYNTIDLQNINLKLELIGDSTNPIIMAENLNLSHVQSKDPDDNIMDQFDFSAGQFIFRDTIKHNHFSIESGKFEKQGSKLSLINFSGGNLQANNKQQANMPGWNYTSSILEFSGLNIRNIVPTKFIMNKLFVGDANITVSTKLNKMKRPGLKFNLESISQLGALMNIFSIDTTVFNQVHVNYISFDDTSSHAIIADSIGIVIHKIHIDSSVLNNEGTDLIKYMSINLKGRTHISKDSLYEIRSGLLGYDFQKDIISIDSFSITPRFDNPEFFKRAKFQTDRIRMFGRRIEIHNFYLEELLTDNYLHFGRVDIDSISLDMARDKNYERRVGDIKPMPQDMLRAIHQIFKIDSLRVFNSFVRYSEYVPKSTIAGSVFFDRFNIKLYNLGNHFLPGDTTASMNLHLDTYIMGQARMDVSLVFPFANNSSNFHLNATSEPLDLTTLNPLTEHLLGISMRKGTGYIQESFISGDEDHSTGTMIFTYKKLKLGLYNRNKAKENKGMFGGLARFLINDIFIHSNNPKFARKPREGMVYFVRDEEKAIINYTWKSVLSGILSTIGINKKEQRQERKEIKNEHKD